MRNIARKIPETTYRKGRYLIAGFLLCTGLLSLLIIKAPLISDIELVVEDEMLKISFNSFMKETFLYTLSSTEAEIKEDSWKEATDNCFVVPLDEKEDYIYLKNSAGQIFEIGSDKDCYLAELTVNDVDIYLGLYEDYQLDYELNISGYTERHAIFSAYDEEIISIDENGLITPLNSGTTTLKISFDKQEEECQVYVSDLLLDRSEGIKNDRDYLGNVKISKEENTILDKILERRIAKAGYKTRAGVLEAARFLTLDIKYKVPYFYENGRMEINVDGEGRYYHKGLYLCEEKTKQLTKASAYGPSPWGYPIYSSPISTKSLNGLDCSGFVTWALVNGGYDPGDLGAGYVEYKDLTDISRSEKISVDHIRDYKPGDLLHSFDAGGHIAIIIGIDDENVYIAEAIWFEPFGVTVTTLDYASFAKRFDKIILMDDYYGEDGNLTYMW